MIRRKHGHSISEIPALVKKEMEFIPEQYCKPSYLRTLIDVCYSYVRYGAGLSDYFGYHFYALNHLGRKSFITRRQKAELYFKVNDPDYRDRLTQKDEFPKYYGRFMGREALSCTDSTPDEQLLAYISELKSKETNAVICKPSNAGAGVGIFKVSISDNALNSVHNLMEKYDSVMEEVYIQKPYLRKKRASERVVVLEPVIENHETIKKLHPASLNTIRISMLREDDSFKITGAALRIGRDGSVVDNLCSGGIAAEIDVESGVVCTMAIDEKNRQYVKHPTTGEIIVGVQIPFWREVKELAMEAAMVTPQIRYVGWDIAVTPKGPVLIEGNTSATFELQQMPRNMGKRYMFESTFKSIHAK